MSDRFGNINTAMQRPVGGMMQNTCWPFVIHVIITAVIVILTYFSNMEYKNSIIVQHVINGLILAVVLNELCTSRKKHLSWILLMSPVIVAIIQMIVLALGSIEIKQKTSNSNED